mmetsp:Transcript_77651/g.251444  ORF Transcript_77651/g.251444 Transcript_77651/m.251444 type:complete len:1503 (-) Transcript_77651:170-4678(-)
MPPKSRSSVASGPLDALRSACKPLKLETVSPEAWQALRSSEAAFSLDLEVDVDHIIAGHLQALASAFEPLALGSSAEAAEQVWEWLGQSVGEGKAKGMPRARALLAILAQALGRPDLLAVAGASYLALLAAEGSEKQWTALFQPACFRQILRALRGLRRGDLKQKKEKAEAGEDGEAEDAGAEEEVDSGIISSVHARELLNKVAWFCAVRGLASSSEAAALAVDELATLVSRPADDAVAREAASGLVGLVARAGGPGEMRRAASAVLRATMPALLMTQERYTSFSGAIPRPLQLARATALNLACGLVRNHPELLNPSPWTDSKDDDAAGGEDADQPPKKRGRKEKGEGKKDDESDEEVTQAAHEIAEVVAADGAADGLAVEGEKKVRRRRPRGQANDDPIVALLELICVLTPDRSEWRSYSTDSIITLLSEVADVEHKAAIAARSSALVTRRLVAKTKDPADAATQEEAEGVALPLADDGGVLVSTGLNAPAALTSAGVERFVSFLSRILESERVCTRVLGTEVAVLCLERSGRLAQGGADGARAELVRRLLVALVRRCSDAVPTVRGRALGGVSAALQSLAKCSEGTEGLLRSVVLEPGHPHHVDLPGLFRSAARDEKPTARRSALNLLDTALPLLQGSLKLNSEAIGSFFDLNLLAGLSADESILVRKASISSLSLLVRLCPCAEAHSLWVANVLPMVLDVEASVGERALDELEAAVLQPLAEQAQADPKNRKGLSIQLPAVLRDIDSEATEYLQRGLKSVAKRNEGKLPKPFLASLVRMLKDCVKQPLPLREWPLGMWAMVEEVSRSNTSGDFLDFDTALAAWVQFSKLRLSTGETPSGLGSKILLVLEHLLPLASADRLDELMSSLSSSLSSFTAPPSLIRAMTSCIDRIEVTWKAKKLYAERAKDRAAWRTSFLKSIQAMLGDACRGQEVAGAHGTDGSRRIEAALFSLGELAMLDSSIISEGVVTQVQTLATNTVYREGCRVETCAAARGQAFSALGKCCLKKDTLAKKCVELFVLYLNPNESFVVRNNVLIVLADLCNLYTSLVDRFIPSMTDLLRDGNELLRKQAAMIIASLLSEDFIKLRGSILFRFLYVLSDPSESVRGFVECVFARILHQRNATMFAQNFLDVVCALNGWMGLASFRGAEGNEDFSLVGSPTRRAVIYRFMLSLMTSDQKFNVCAQIVTTLLASFVDAEEATPLPKSAAEPAGQTLSDGLTLLCCKEMRICFTTQRAGQDDEDVEGGGGGDEKKGAADAARGVLSSILKRNMCDNIIPVLVQLKSLMEARHSPFLKTLRHCLREILRDFKDDLPAMLAGDPQLASEIAYDLQKESAGEPDGGASGAAALPVAASQDVAPGARPLPHLGGASRRMSLGTMMRPPSTPTQTPAAPTPLMDLEAPSTPCAGAEASQIPKPRRSSGGGFGTGFGAAALPRQSLAAAGAARRRSAAQDLLKASQDSGEAVAAGGKRRAGGVGGGKRRKAAEAEGQQLQQPIHAGGA